MNLAAYQVAGKNDFGTILNEVLDGGYGCTDPCVISDVLVVVERDIEVCPHEHPLPLQVRGGQVPNALLRHGDNPSYSLP